ncbi:MAG: hypothetical protein ABFD69_01270 [Candidatus Sumerlaeia bacterium]
MSKSKAWHDDDRFWKLKEAGFATVDIYGDLAGAPYDQNATRLVAVARKTK